MEPITIMTVAIGVIAVLHIIDNVAKALAKGKGVTATRTGTRSDWYCFFRMSDLLGPDWKPFTEQERERKHLTDTKRNEQRRKQANRPRLYV